MSREQDIKYGKKSKRPIDPAVKKALAEVAKRRENFGKEGCTVTKG